MERGKGWADARYIWMNVQWEGFIYTYPHENHGHSVVFNKLNPLRII